MIFEIINKGKGTIESISPEELLLIKEDALESGITIKTLNNQSLLGAGNITIEGLFDKNFEYVQGVPSDSWLIDHPLKKKVSVVVVDSGGTCIEGAVNYLSDSRIIIEFNGSFSGTAILN